MNAEEKANEIIASIKSYVEGAIAIVDVKIVALKKQLEALPVAKDGKDGTNGEPGADGFPGLPGKDGEPGKDGKDGRDGRDGRDGEDGRDAAEIEILPTINEEKSYPKGVFATHRGGLWYSKEKTEGMKGWKIVAEGIHKINFHKTASRKFIATIENSSAKVQKAEFEMPVLIYQGIYKSGENYVVGDTVTFAGALWHCNTPTKEKPGESKDWTLAAKRGRDATEKKTVKVTEKYKL